MVTVQNRSGYTILFFLKKWIQTRNAKGSRPRDTVRQKHQPYNTHHTTLTQLEKEGQEGKKGKREGKIPGGWLPGIVELLKKGAIERQGKAHVTNICLKNGQFSNIEDKLATGIWKGISGDCLFLIFPNGYWAVKITGLFQKALANSANSVEPERKIWLQRDARVQQKVKKTCSTSRGQERNTEGEMPNKRDQFCQWERCNATKKKTNQREQNRNPIP